MNAFPYLFFAVLAIVGAGTLWVMGRPAFIDWRIRRMLRPYGFVGLNSFAILMSQNEGFAHARGFKNAVSFSAKDEENEAVRGYVLLHSMFGEFVLLPLEGSLVERPLTEEKVEGL